MRCSNCGSENPQGKRFCGHCGAALNNTGGVQPPMPSPAVSAALPSAGLAELPESERKIITALFADIKGSTELMRDLDPEEARAQTNWPNKARKFGFAQVSDLGPEEAMARYFMGRTDGLRAPGSEHYMRARVGHRS